MDSRCRWEKGKRRKARAIVLQYAIPKAYSKKLMGSKGGIVPGARAKPAANAPWITTAMRTSRLPSTRGVQRVHSSLEGTAVPVSPFLPEAASPRLADAAPIAAVPAFPFIREQGSLGEPSVSHRPDAVAVAPAPRVAFL